MQVLHAKTKDEKKTAQKETQDKESKWRTYCKSM